MHSEDFKDRFWKGKSIKLKKLYFENGQGRVDMFLGGAGPVRVTSLSGFGNPAKKYSTVVFEGKSGQKTLSSNAMPRTIIISGDVNTKDKNTMKNMFKVLDEPGWLYVDFGEKKKKIYCNQVNLEDGAHKGNYMNFVLSMTADEVFFLDIEQTDISVFIKEGTILNKVIFPCILTRKITEATINNYGEENVEPVITICNYYSKIVEEDDTIIILNDTTGQKIELVVGMEENEIITIDIKNRKVLSSVKGNITSDISDDTYLNRFWLCPGENLLKASHNNLEQEISVVCSYFSNYREAIC